MTADRSSGVAGARPDDGPGSDEPGTGTGFGPDAGAQAGAGMDPDAGAQAGRDLADESRRDTGARQESGADADPAGDADMPDTLASPVPLLPEVTRRRVAALTTTVMRDLRPNQVPAQLRVAAKWRPGKVPQGFVDQVLSALIGDPGFRERVGAALSEQDPLGRSMATGSIDPGADPASVTALLYLIRPEAWPQRLAEALALLPVEDEAEEDPVQAAALAVQLRAKLERAKQRREREVAEAIEAGAAERTRLVATAERLRSQVAQLRQELQVAAAAAEEYRHEALALDRTVRRLRVQLQQAEQQVGQLRGTGREAKIAANARARVLLDVLAQAVAGLGDELALPAGTPLPADLVEAAIPSQPARIRRINTAADLARELTLPRCHLIVDGYNLTKGLWPNHTLQQQRERLISALEMLVARTRAEVTAVFDGAEVGAVPTARARTVRVRFSPPGEPADRVIVRLVGADATGRPLVVASSDAALAAGARNAGAATADREVLAELLGPGPR